MAPAAMIGAMTDHDHDSYRPTSAWRRLLILVLAVGMALFIVWALLTRPGHVPKPRPNAPPCATGQTQNCVGGQIDVIVAPRAEPAASAANGAASAPADR